MVNSDAECEAYMELLTDVFLDSPGNFHLFKNKSFVSGAVGAVIVWQLDVQLPMQSVPITTDVVSSNLDQGEVYNIM